MSQPYTPPEAELAEKETAKVPKGILFLSVCMVLGSIISIFVIIALAGQLLEVPGSSIIFGPFLILFIFYLVKGVSLWKHGAKYYKTACWLFVIQIPIVSFSGFQYDLFTGFLIALLFGDVDSNLLFNLGGGFNFYVAGDFQDTYFGINIFALISSIYIYRLMSGKSKEE